MPFISVNTNRVQFNITLQEKVIFIRGYSGAGKSLIVQEIQRLLRSGLNMLSTDCDVYLYLGGTIPAFTETENPILYICDENEGGTLLNFIRGKKVYALIVSRKKYATWSYSYKSIYEAERCEDGVTRIKPKYNIVHTPLEINKSLVIITEDSGAGHRYIKEKLSNYSVIPAGGKDKIKDKLLELYSQGFKSMLVICDEGGLGSAIRQLIAVVKSLKSNGCSIQFLLPVCFEQVLLCSNFIGDSKNVYETYDNYYDSTEKFCESRIAKLTKGTVLEYDHENTKDLSNCWKYDCSMCSSKECKYMTEDCKDSYVLQNGPLKALLEIQKY